jgi:hypothetical protein
VRRAFLQQKTEQAIRPGPLHKFVKGRDVRGLDLYLAVLLVAGGAPYKAIFEASVWARILGITGPSRYAAVSRIWKRLAALKLIKRGRAARVAAVTLLLEDGSGAAYTRPSGDGQPSELYFSIPLEYWTQEWYARLELPAKAMLLIALSLGDGFYLPIERAPQWYGISADTTHRGLTELRQKSLLRREVNYKHAPLTAQGWTVQYHYTLQPPFGPKGVSSTAALDDVKSTSVEASHGA